MCDVKSPTICRKPASRLGECLRWKYKNYEQEPLLLNENIVSRRRSFWGLPSDMRQLMPNMKFRNGNPQSLKPFFMGLKTGPLKIESAIISPFLFTLFSLQDSGPFVVTRFFPSPFRFLPSFLNAKRVRNYRNSPVRVSDAFAGNSSAWSVWTT